MFKNHKTNSASARIYLCTHVFFSLIMLIGLSACTGSTGNATAAPTLTAVPATALPAVKTFPLDDDHSIIHFKATLSLGNIVINGTFNTKGKFFTISAQGSQTHIAIDLQIDGNSVTSPGNIGVSTLKAMLETTQFPYAHFTASVDIPTADLGATPSSSNAVGTLELHGKTLPVQMPVTLAINDGQVSAGGEITLELTDYAVIVPSLIKSKITLQADLVTHLEADMATLAATLAPTP